MSHPTTPHDALFKKFLGHTDTARDFLDIHLPKPLRALCDLSTLRPESASFIEPTLRNACSDILYSLQTTQGDGYIYCVIEHQSTPDPLMAFRLMRYSTCWLENFDDPEAARVLYGNPFPLVDVTVMPDDEILHHKRIALLELVQKHIWQRDLLELLAPVAYLLRIANATDEQLEALLNYMLQVGNTADPEKFTKRLIHLSPDEQKERMMTIAEQLEQIGWKKGWEKGRMRGWEEGREEGRGESEAVLARLLTRRFGPLPEWARERLHRADAAQREAWADAVLDAASLTEVVGAPPESH
jgi:predicted transposase YdaD